MSEQRDRDVARRIVGCAWPLQRAQWIGGCCGGMAATHNRAQTAS